MVEMVCRAYDERLKVEMVAGLSMEQAEGRYFEGPTPLMRMAGPMRSLLSAERVVLNFVQRMSGVATLTRKFVQAGRGAKVYDTRKTVPGHRVLDKYAVVCGGGFNHRSGLYDAVFVKDNHLAGVGLAEMAGFLADVVGRARAESAVRQVVVEVDTLEQLTEVLKVGGVDVVLLDNMECDTMRRAVGMRDASGSKAELEASGGVTLETIGAIAATGVERISVGAMTHSAPALDISLDVG
jgi:nicotinate-nucleotide pyrophosphorylase (carboxylating)